MTAPPRVRVGQGIDVHAFSDDPARRLILGGVDLSGEGVRGLAGHSDADVVAHAICDAVLGAGGLGDLGRHMPDTDPRWRDADSLDILRRVVALVVAAGWDVVNADCTVVAERPRLAPHVDRMAELLSGALGAPVNVKATGPKVSAPGPGRGIACTAVVLLSGDDATGPSDPVTREVR